MRPVYSFITRSGSRYILEENPQTGTLHLLQWTEINGMSGYAGVMYDIDVCPPHLEVGDRPLFQGTSPSGIRPGEYRICTSPVKYVAHADRIGPPEQVVESIAASVRRQIEPVARVLD